MPSRLMVSARTKGGIARAMRHASARFSIARVWSSMSDPVNSNFERLPVVLFDEREQKWATA